MGNTSKNLGRERDSDERKRQTHKVEEAVTKGICTLEIASIIAILLRCAGIIEWPWGIVLLPLAIPALGFVVMSIWITVEGFLKRGK